MREKKAAGLVGRWLGRAALVLLSVVLLAMVSLETISLVHQSKPGMPETLQGRNETLLQGQGELFAGAFETELHVPAGGPIAGYPQWRRDSGSGERLFVRALVLQQGPLSAVLVSLPLMLVPGSLEEEIARRAGVAEDMCLTVTATHTHSGPGGTWKNRLVELGGNGLYSGERVDAIAQAAADAIVAARRRLAPARVAAAMENFAEGPAVARSGAIDPALGAARIVDRDGRAIASIAVYGMHATVIPRRERSLSGDWPEAAAIALEQASGAPALILQGAVGNATWSRNDLPGDPQQAAAALGARVALEASRLMSRAPIADSTSSLKCSTRFVPLPEPRAGRALNVLWRRTAGNLLRIFSDRTAVQTTLSFPGLELIGIPGEPAGDLALSLRSATNAPVMLVGLADGYAGYVESAAHWNRGEGESERTWYGPELAAALSIEPSASTPQAPLLNKIQ